MLVPTLDDTIIAVSSGWQAAPLGIVRLSGPAAFELLQCLEAAPPPTESAPHPCAYDASLSVDSDLVLPATIFRFHAPRSYTGQNVAEIHTVGSLPALRAVAARLIDLGARRALPGEFTARAFLNGRLNAEEVDRVLALINADDESTARQTARLARASHQTRLRDANDRLTELIALVEAGIDFVEEEDVRFINPVELVQAIDDLLERFSAIGYPNPALRNAGKPHVALAGVPNAGKSTLFNTLLGHERAIVAPVLGTTRDVLSAEINLGDISIVLQDCAGLGAAADDLETAAHLAAEQTADRADLVLWVHDSTTRFDAREIEVCRRIPVARRQLVLSKIDQLTGKPDQPAELSFRAVVPVSALTGIGMRDLRRSLAHAFESSATASSTGLLEEHLGAAAAALRRARRAADTPTDALPMPEIVASELRRAWEAVGLLNRGPLVEDVLSKILARFCIGK